MEESKPHLQNGYRQCRESRTSPGRRPLTAKVCLSVPEGSTSVRAHWWSSGVWSRHTLASTDHEHLKSVYSFDRLKMGSHLQKGLSCSLAFIDSLLPLWTSRKTAKESLAQTSSSITENLMGISRMMSQQVQQSEEAIQTLGKARPAVGVWRGTRPRPLPFCLPPKLANLCSSSLL